MSKQAGANQAGSQRIAKIKQKPKVLATAKLT